MQDNDRTIQLIDCLHFAVSERKAHVADHLHGKTGKSRHHSYSLCSVDAEHFITTL